MSMPKASRRGSDVATGPQNQPDEALVDLLVKQVTEGLSPAEQRELDVLDSAVASDYLRELERAAAAVTLAGTRAAEPLPAALAGASGSASAGFSQAPAGKRWPPAHPPARRRCRLVGRRRVLVLAVFGWLRAPQPNAPVAVAGAGSACGHPPPIVPAAPPTPAEERAALLARAGFAQDHIWARPRIRPPPA
jgi:hypothetical protein